MPFESTEKLQSPNTWHGLKAIGEQTDLPPNDMLDPLVGQILSN